MAITLDRINRYIIVGSPDTDVTIQSLINAIRDYEDEPANLDLPKIADASGKEALGGGLSVGITLKLLNWKVQFADRAGPSYILCTISGGNLVAVDANNVEMNPIQPSAFTTVTRAVAVSAAIVENDKAAIADAVWDEAANTHTISGSFGEKTSDIQNKLREMYTLLGLDPAYPVTISQTSRQHGAMQQTISVVGETITIQRNV